MRVKYLILGAGPTGLAAAHRLAELGESSFLVLEKNDHVGGLSASFTDKAGFTWDVGGHVVFSHYAYFDRLLDSLLGQDVLKHQREAWIRVAKTWVPYPFQNNIRHLPRELLWECVRGLLPGNRIMPKSGAPENFGEWIDMVFGPGVARLFMRPYNFKVWATPAERMSHRWIGERVSVIDLERVLKNIFLETDDVSWGPNNTFQFPLRGGTGEIFRRLAAPLASRIKLSSPVAAVDPVRKTARTASGVTYAYERLLQTGPLDLFVSSALRRAPEAVRQAASLLEHNGAFIHGLGVSGRRPDSKCWMYFPEDDCPFYRVTNFHNYSPFNTPDPEGMVPRDRAIMTETSFSPHKSVDPATIEAETTRGLLNTGLLDDGEEARVVSSWNTRVEHAYPIPTLTRDKALAIIQPWLESQGIFSRGRFGGWKYEVGNMDHSVMQGVEWADRMVKGSVETVYPPLAGEVSPITLTNPARSGKTERKRPPKAASPSPEADSTRYAHTTHGQRHAEVRPQARKIARKAS